MRNSKLTTITDALLLFLAFIIFIDSVLDMKDTVLLKQKLMNRIFQNTGLPPIEKISVSRNFCDKDNDYFSFFNYTFPGVLGGSFNKLTYKFSDSRCVVGDQNFRYCVNIPRIKPQYMSVWEDKVMCLKRYDQESFDKYRIISKNEMCPIGYRKCGFYNQYEDIICMSQELPCPINSIEFKTKSKINPLDTTYDYFKLDNDNYLVVSNNITENILPIDFIVAEYYPCLEVERISYNPKYPIYPRMNNLNLFNCQKDLNSTYSNSTDYDEIFDKRYQKLYSLPKKNFFFDNDLFKKYSALPDIKNWKNDMNYANYTISMRSYISVNLTCSSLDDFNNFKSSLEKLKIMKFTQMVLALLNVFLLCFFISLLSLVKIIKRWLHTILTLIKIIFSAFYLIYNIILSYQNFDITLSLNHYLTEVLPYCVDKYVNSGMIIYDVLHNIRDVNLVNRLIYFFSIFYGCILAMQLLRVMYKVYVRIKNRKRREQARNELGEDLFKNIVTKYTTTTDYNAIEDN